MRNQEKQQSKQKLNFRVDSAAIRRMVLTAMLFAAALVLTVVEYQIPIPMPVPGVRLGLSNIVVMYSLFFLKKRDAFTLAVLKSFFVFLTRGAVAALISFCGGMMSILVMMVLMAVLKDRISYLMVSVAGAVFHNLGQIAAVSLLYTNLLLWAYLPVLLITGILAGTATSSLLRITLPALKRLGLKETG